MVQSCSTLLIEQANSTAREFTCQLAIQVSDLILLPRSAKAYLINGKIEHPHMRTHYDNLNVSETAPDEVIRAGRFQIVSE
jgi:hypothetical protein